MKANILLAWLGAADLRASRGEPKGSLGPIGSALTERTYTHAHLLCNYPDEDSRRYAKWIRGKCETVVTIHKSQLSKPTMLGEIYEAAIDVLAAVKEEHRPGRYSLTYHLSPGTPQMAIIWMILANSTHPAELIESSVVGGVNTLQCPFELAVNYLPPLPRKLEAEILQLTQGLPPAAPEFASIIHAGARMRECVAQARRLALFDFPMVIEGESGTGKELFAKAIHASSVRSGGAFVSVNCGAIPAELVEAEFFGHVKGAFTGAIANRDGYVVQADGGTLFLDEVGELPLTAQVKLLRAIQERTVQPLGGAKPRKVDFRIIAATNRSLMLDVRGGRFRNDLFHRLAVGMLRLPALRDRREDLNLLIEYFLERINADCARVPGWKNKALSPGARNVLHRHSWPGNVRELLNTLTRAAIWTPRETIRGEDLDGLLFSDDLSAFPDDPVLNRTIGDDFRLTDLVGEVSRHYLKRALETTGGNRSRAAGLLGFASYQTLNNWVQKYAPELLESER